MYYGCSKDSMEAGTKRLVGNTTRTATSDEVGGSVLLQQFDLKTLHRTPEVARNLQAFEAPQKRKKREYHEPDRTKAPSRNQHAHKLCNCYHLVFGFRLCPRGAISTPYSMVQIVSRGLRQDPLCSHGNIQDWSSSTEPRPTNRHKYCW